MFDEETTVGEHFGFKPPKQSKENALLITNDCLGFEIELEQAHHVARGKHWATHDDGSLRNNGIEFVFNRPYSGDDVVGALTWIDDSCKQAISAGYPPEKSVRTSVHTHVDVTDLFRKELIDMILVYTIFELPFFKAFAPERYEQECHFCIPYNDVLELTGVPRWLHQGYEVFENNANNPNIGRYCAFNLKSIFKFGTIEFRHHPGEWEKERLLLWANACLSFKRAGRAGINFKTSFFENSANGFEGMLRHVFPRDVSEFILTKGYNYDLKAFNKDVISGIRIAQQATLPRVRI